MHTNDLMSALRDAAANLRDRDGRGVGGEDGVVRDTSGKTLEDELLDLKVFICSLNDEVDVVQLADLLGKGNPVLDVLRLLGSHSFLTDFFGTPV